MINWKGVADVEGLAAVVTKAMTEAHDNLAAAQVTSRQKGEGVYGQIWRSLCDDLVARLREERLEVQVIKPSSFPYQLPVIGDAILFPWRPAGGHTPTDIAFGTSPTRQRLWKQSLSQHLLPFVVADSNVDDSDSALEGRHECDVPPEMVEEFVADAARQHLRVIIVAMTSDARRLRSIEWGEAELDGNAVLEWSPEPLYVISNTSAPASTSPRTFNDGNAPTPGVTLKPQASPMSADGTTSGSTDSAPASSVGDGIGSTDQR